MMPSLIGFLILKRSFLHVKSEIQTLFVFCHLKTQILLLYKYTSAEMEFISHAVFLLPNSVEECLRLTPHLDV